MSQFKYKTDKLKHQVKIVTLDETHRKFAKNFEDARNDLEQKEEKLALVQNKLNKLNKLNQSTLQPKDIKLKAELKDEIIKLTKEINDVKSNKSEMDYYGKIHNILLKYYDMMDNNENDKLSTSDCSSEQYQIHKKQTKKRTKNKSNNYQNILSFFETSKTPGTESNDSCDKIEVTKSESYKDEFCDNSLPKNKAYLNEQYMRAINSNNTNKNIVKKFNNCFKFCEKCKIERTLIQADGIYVCGNCGDTECVLIESDIPNYKDNVCEKPTYPYKRLNHLSE